MPNITESRYYSDDSTNRYFGKLMYHRDDIINILYDESSNKTTEYNDKTDVYKQKQKLWDFVFSTEKNDVNKNIFYLYYYERKKQSEIAYLCDRTQAYVAKVIRKITIKAIDRLVSKQLELPFV